MIRRRDRRADRIALLMTRDANTRFTLVRANALTCATHLANRQSHSLACTTCNGTGYTSGNREDLPNLETLGAPYNTLYFVAGDLQMGHGLRGSGGSSAYAEGDRGVEQVGDGILYFPANQYETTTGALVAPIIGNLPRPDRIIRAEDGQVFTVLHALDEKYGSSPLYTAYAVGIGLQGSSIENVP